MIQRKKNEKISLLVLKKLIQRNFVSLLPLSKRQMALGKLDHFYQYTQIYCLKSWLVTNGAAHNRTSLISIRECIGK
jgi:hypothetical protein